VQVRAGVGQPGDADAGRTGQVVLARHVNKAEQRVVLEAVGVAVHEAAHLVGRGDRVGRDLPLHGGRRCRL